MKWIVTQIGNREHYACPWAFHREGLLARFYTDIWAGPLLRAAARWVPPLRAIGGRFHGELRPDQIVAFNPGGIRWIMKQRKVASQGNKALHEMYEQVGKWFSEAVRNHLERRPLDPARHAVYAFSTGALETLEYTRSLGMTGVVNQLDPARMDHLMIAEERLRWPGWDTTEDPVPESYLERLKAEWNAADHIVVNSEFSKRAVVMEGIRPDKVAVVPLAYVPESKVLPNRMGRTAGQPLKVLWLGQIVLRKGIPYLFEACRLLQARNVPVEVTVVGTVGITDHAIAQAPPNVRVLGRVSREEALKHYTDADCFVLPTISDGFAITQIEAMSYGLPVIVTPNCGDVVTDGSDGFIIPIRDPEALAERMARLAADRRLLAAMSQAAVTKSRQFSLERYSKAIVNILGSRGASMKNHTTDI